MALVEPWFTPPLPLNEKTFRQKDMIPYQKLFSGEDLKDLYQWVKEHRAALPESLWLDDATHIPDLRTTAGHYLEIIELHRENPTYSGQIYQLFKIREKVEELWAKEGKTE